MTGGITVHFNAHNGEYHPGASTRCMKCAKLQGDERRGLFMMIMLDSEFDRLRDFTRSQR